jgi:hypothetical protein
MNLLHCKAVKRMVPNNYIMDVAYTLDSETFPAVNMIVMKDKTIIGVQIHISKKVLNHVNSASDS